MTMMAPLLTRSTPNDVLRLEEEGLYELVDDQLKEKAMSSLANETAAIICARLFNHIETTAVGKLYVEQTFQCFPDKPLQVRRPDLAFVATQRLSAVDEDGHVKIAPDLAIEIISPNDTAYDLEEKLDDYRSAKFGLIWIVYPKHRRIHIYAPGQAVLELREADTLTGGGVLPGFSITFRDMLPK
jgi:Uma2 family endonuclease